MLEIREYQDEDQDAVWELHVLGLEQTDANAGHGAWDDDLRNIRHVYLRRNGTFLVGEYAGRIVAMGAFRRTSPTSAEIKRMRVHPDLQRHGFGQAILNALEARALAMGVSTLHLDTTVRQTAAQRLYERNDYKEVGRTILGGLESILYEKDMQSREMTLALKYRKKETRR
jgi:GNAT superfamily N-acetyltransferase